MTIKSTDQQYTFNFVEAQKDNFPYTITGNDFDKSVHSWPEDSWKDFNISIEVDAAVENIITKGDIGISNLLGDDPDYKFNEGALISEFKKYVDSTYNSHYSKEKFQATEFIIDGGHGTGFCIGNVLKYAQRYGKKGAPKDARKDLMKVLHYALIQLSIHDEDNK